MTAMIVGFVTLVIGILIGRLGLWWRLERIEARLRGLRLGLYDHEVFEGKTIETHWVIDHLTEILHREFSGGRSDSEIEDRTE